MEEPVVAQVVGRTLAALGVDTVFGLLGSGNAVVTNALVAAGATFHAARHEGGATAMADGWARSTGRVGVVSVHQGPGLTNTLTALGEAAKSRTPLVVLSGETPAAALRSNFRIDQHDLVASVGAVAERVHGPATAADDAARALRRAALERRPVVLMLPIDLQVLPVPGAGGPGEGDAVGADGADGAVGPDGAVGTDGAVGPGDAGASVRPGEAAGSGGTGHAAGTPATSAPLPRPAAPNPRDVDEVAALLRRAERPVILAGRGAVVADAGPALRALAEACGALVASSAVAKGMFAGDPFGLGISGGFSTALAAELLPRADVVLAVGATLNHWTTRHGALIGPDAVVVQVDAEADALGANRPADLGVVGDARLTAEALAGAVAPADADRGASGTDDAPATWRTAATAHRIATERWRDEPYEDAGTDAYVDPRSLTIALQDLLPADRAVAVDSGHFLGWPSFGLDVPDARSWVFANAFQAVGLGLGCAIGAAVARPDRVTVAALGDGGTFLALQELETAARLGLRLLVVVYDDAAYGAEVHHFRTLGEAVGLARFPPVDLAAVARACGAEGLVVRSVADLEPVAAWVASGAGPLVLDAKVHPDVCAAWLEDAFRAG